MNVILAEDDLDIQLVARLALKRAGFIVKVVGNGQEALDAVQGGSRPTSSCSTG